MDKLLMLFTDYLRRVQGRAVTLEQTRTDKGLIYGFYSADGDVVREELSDQLEQFSSFLTVCIEDPAKASELLELRRLPISQIQSIVTRYAKEARRLLMDIKHEKETKFLSLRQRLEAELLDTATDSERTAVLALIQKGAKTDVSNTIDILQPSDSSTKHSIVITENVNINNPQFISDVKGIVAQNINGVVYSDEDEKIIRLIKTHSFGLESLELKSALDELNDESLAQPARITAWQKIQGFLVKHSGTIGKSALTILEKYIEHKLTGK